MYKSPPASPSPLERADRVVSVDALRGFDMFWILGGEEIVHALNKAHPTSWLSTAAEQMDHCDWEGFRFYDLIFPMFVFIAGVSIVLSLSKAGGNKASAIRRILVRSVFLFALGIIYNGGLSNAWPGIRLFGVLQRIAICYLVASVLFIYFQPRTLALVAVTLLLGYWAMLLWVPVPNVGRGHFEIGHNLADWTDQKLLPGKLYRSKEGHDPEGLLSTLPAIVNCLLGVFAGLLLRGASAPWRKVVILLLGGALCTAVGMAWGGKFPNLAFLQPIQIPIIKKIWTSSFVLVTSGYSAMLLGAFYLLVDVWKLRTWATPFIWIGMNAIALYLITRFVNFGAGVDDPKKHETDLARLFVGGDVARWLGHELPLVRACVAVMLMLLLARFMYKKQVFIRL